MAVIILLSSILYLYLTDEGVANYRRFNQLHVGMKRQQALKMMGNPSRILEDTDKGRRIYFYTRPRYLVSDDMKVVVDNKSDKVIVLVEPE